jgi:hypothetical protein
MELFTISFRPLLLFTLLAALTLAASSLYIQPEEEYNKIHGPGSLGLTYAPAGNFKTTKDSAPPIHADPSTDEDVLEEEMERKAEEYDKIREPGSVGLNYASAGNMEITKDSAPPIYVHRSIDEDVPEEDIERKAKEYDKTRKPESVGLNYAPAGNLETTKDSTPLIYIDRLIDEDIIKEIEEEEYEESRLGPGSIGITYRYYKNETDNTTTLTEHGTQLRWRQETISNGSFELLAQGLISENLEDEKIKDGRVLFRQQDYALSDRLQMDSEVGHFRSFTPTQVSRSYRFYLPSTILQGVNTRFYNNDTSLSFNAGEIGTYKGIAAQAFEKTQGKLYGLGVTHRVDDQWELGGQFWNTVDPENEENHRSYAGVLEYQDAESSQNLQIHFIGDSEGNTGLWFDNKYKYGKWHHYSGAFYFEPDLLWTDAPIDNDREGLYLRSNRKSYRWQWTLGSEVSKNNLDKDPEIAGNITTASFVNGTWRYRRKTQFGGSLNLSTTHADSGTAEDDSKIYGLKSFTQHQFASGTSRVQLSLNENDAPEDDTTSYGILWDHGWKAPFLSRLNTDIEYTWTDNKDDELSLRLCAEKSLLADVKITGTAQHVITEDNTIGKSKGTSLSFSLSWQFYYNWLISLNADYNRNMTDPESTESTTTDGKTVLFSISYARASGRKPLLYGRPTGNHGRGRITGNIFLDENKDGRQGINETALKNILVYLDGRFTTETDSDGKFEFWPVASGDHYISIGIEDVPLPWGLEDESAKQVYVPIRGEGEIDFALIKLNE